MPKALKPYLTYSAALHFGAFGGVMLLLAWNKAMPPNPVYNIDFVGPSAVVTNLGSAPASAPAGAAKAQPEKRPGDFNLKKRRGALPKPSLLKGYKEPAAAAAETPAQDDDAAQPEGLSGSAGIATDMPNFPYPWYISQIRASLWNQWASRMPAQAGEAVVVFTVLPNGGVVDLRIESSSGDSAFDLTALGAVRDAGPYPPLPRGFPEPFLKIHVTLKSK